MKRLITLANLFFISLCLVGSLTSVHRYIYVFSGVGFSGVLIFWLILFMKRRHNERIVKYLKIAFYLTAIYFLIGLVFGLAIGTFPEKDFVHGSNIEDTIGFANGIIISFSNLTTLSVTNFVPQTQFLRFISLFESILSFFMLSAGVGIMVNESTR